MEENLQYIRQSPESPNFKGLRHCSSDKMVQISLAGGIMHNECARKNMCESIKYRDNHPPLTRPKDFNTFWIQTLDQLAQQDLGIQPLQHESAEGLTLQWLSFRSFGGALIHAYCLSWNDEQPHPLVIHTHGYIGQCDVMWRWAKRGLNVFGFDIRGYGRSHDAINERSSCGYILTGIESQQTSVLRGAVCDYVRAQDVAEYLLGARPQRSIYYGNSFAGALAFIAAAITKIPDLLIAAVPTLGWAEGRLQWVKKGSGLEINQYLERYPEQTEQVMKVLSYFDTMNFADRVTCPALIGLGVRDEVVPAPTVYAIINHLSSPYEVREFPVSHSSEPQEKLWFRFESEWLELAVNGASQSFGGGEKLRVMRS